METLYNQITIHKINQKDTFNYIFLNKEMLLPFEMSIVFNLPKPLQEPNYEIIFNEDLYSLYNIDIPNVILCGDECELFLTLHYFIQGSKISIKQRQGDLTNLFDKHYREMMFTRTECNQIANKISELNLDNFKFINYDLHKVIELEKWFIQVNQTDNQKMNNFRNTNISVAHYYYTKKHLDICNYKKVKSSVNGKVLKMVKFYNLIKFCDVIQYWKMRNALLYLLIECMNVDNDINLFREQIESERFEVWYQGFLSKISS